MRRLTVCKTCGPSCLAASAAASAWLLLEPRFACAAPSPSRVARRRHHDASLSLERARASFARHSRHFRISTFAPISRPGSLRIASCIRPGSPATKNSGNQGMAATSPSMNNRDPPLKRRNAYPVGLWPPVPLAAVAAAASNAACSLASVAFVGIADVRSCGLPLARDPLPLVPTSGCKQCADG